jgi:hypothetical protein
MPKVSHWWVVLLIPPQLTVPKHETSLYAAMA